MTVENRVNRMIRATHSFVFLILVVGTVCVGPTAWGVAPKRTSFSKLPWQPLEIPRNHGAFICFAIPPNGRVIAAGMDIYTVPAGKRLWPGEKRRQGGEVVLWSTRSGKLMGVLDGHDERVDWLEYSSDGKTLVSISSKNLLVQVWNAPRAKLKNRFRLKGAFSFWTKPALDGNGKSLANVQIRTIQVADDKIDIRDELTVWDIPQGTPRWSIPESGVTAMAFSPNGSTLAGCVEHKQWYVGDDGKSHWRDRTQRLVMWDGATGKQLWESELHKKYIRQLAFLPHEPVLISLDDDKLVRWDVNTGEKLGAIPVEGEDIAERLVLSRQKPLACIAQHMGDMIQLWDLKKEKPHTIITAAEDSDRVWNMGISPDLRYMACIWRGRPVVMRLLKKKR